MSWFEQSTEVHKNDASNFIAEIISSTEFRNGTSVDFAVDLHIPYR